ncbi:uncharacterized protein LOC132726823 [Ruditapes philippinarum]|uniref:uncharacterized protein LOC132726823 n=1 Tax=Ruditapes philippinarum TaxID=129788 RepID=UPI00295C324E|nr:uncharacterized protein LOC132726823 [Ruditapes philippinarum]
MDKNVIQYCLGLIKCSKSLLKKTKSAVKTNGNCESDECITVRRRGGSGGEIKSGSGRVYPPLNSSVVHEKALELGRVNRELLDFLRHSHVIEKMIKSGWTS